MPPSQEHSALTDYLHVLRRRKWIALATVAAVTGLAFGLSQLQDAKYKATAQVLLSRSLATALSGVTDPNQGQSADRLAQTQADLARVPTVINQTIAAAGNGEIGPGELSAASSVTARSDADLLVFSVTERSPDLAARLATAYAQQYILYRKQLDTQALTRARTQVQARIAELEAGGERKSALYATLAERDQQLATMQALQTSNSTLVKKAQGASQVQPTPKRNIVLGFILGLMLGLAAAFLRDTLDTRVRTAADVSNVLGLPLLARIPAPTRSMSSGDQLVMLAEPRSSKAEPFRMLRTNLGFVNLEHKARTLVITSALEGEGKSTTAANLAVALARAGNHVVLVDLDLRRPYLHRFFGITDSSNLAEVVLAKVALEQALVSIPISERPASPAVMTNGGGSPGGVLEVLVTGPVPPNPGEFSGSPVVADILARLAKRAAYVIVDTAPILGVGDTLALSRSVDAMVVVTRLNRLRKPMLKELHRMLEGTPVDVLGFVVTEAETEGQYGYGYAYGYGETARRGSERAPWPAGESTRSAAER